MMRVMSVLHILCCNSSAEVTCPLVLTRSLHVQNGSGCQCSGQFSGQNLLAKSREKFGGPASAMRATAASGAANTITNEGGQAANALASWRAQRDCQLDINNMPVTELLTTQVRSQM